ncbi:sarcinarray family MAST domain-containing protein [Methanomethylovorans sp.]|uniref:sarcinarray family MAST domain-containing protein n=1 Tax=Methanomethylovorans sp. TaxID=2758717 RepID=UPI00351C7C49
MNYKVALTSILCLLVIFSSPASSESPYGKIDVYYNDQLYPGNSTPKPLLKIGEPFKLRFEVTCYRRNFLAVQLWSIGNDDFIILDGPTSSLGIGTRGTIEENETRIFEWTVAPTEEWAGGSAPINFYYQMTDLERPITLASGEFTAAYVTISNEYYGPSSAITKPGAQFPGDTTSPALPAFTLPAALVAMCIIYVLRRQ